MRECYRSKWRLHEDPAILTAGRYYRAADDAPVAPFATYYGSREWSPEPLLQPFGEWGGAQGYDQGVPPRVLPGNGVIGGDCISKLLPPPPEDLAARQFGRCIDLPTQSICGNIPLFTNFSVANDREITYYEHVPTYVTKDKGEGEWSGAVPDFAATARIRVTEVGSVLQWMFALCDASGASPIVTPCCTGTPVPANLLMLAAQIGGYTTTSPPGVPDWQLNATNIPLVYGTTPFAGSVGFPTIPAWWGLVKCDGTPGNPSDFGYVIAYACVGAFPFADWLMTVLLPDGNVAFDRNDFLVILDQCSPFHQIRSLGITTRHTGPICGNPVIGNSIYMSYDIGVVP